MDTAAPPALPRVTVPADPDPAPFTGERFVSSCTGFIQHEHYHRYLLAGQYVAGREVLDIASGEGFGSAYLAQTAADVVGVDVDPEAVERATRVFRGENLAYRVGDCTAIPLPDASRDMIVSFETLEHVIDQDGFFRECRRVLRPDGALIVSTPDTHVFSPGGFEPDDYHLKELDRPEFEALIARHFDRYAIVGQSPLLRGSVISGEHPGAPSFYAREVGDRTFEMGAASSQSMYLIALIGDLPPPAVHVLDGSYSARLEHEAWAAAHASAAAAAAAAPPPEPEPAPPAPEPDDLEALRALRKECASALTRLGQAQALRRVERDALLGYIADALGPDHRAAAERALATAVAEQSDLVEVA